MSYDYSENILVQESAGHLLENELGWEVAFAYNTEKLGENGTFGRKSYREILLARYFREALLRLNPWITPAQMDEAQRTLEYRLSTASLLQINEEKYFLIRDGIPVTVKKPGGRTETKYATVIDFRNPDNNHFLAIKELKIHGDLYRRRTDIVGFVNGIPLLFIELKKNTVDVQDAYTNNYTDYLDTIPHLFYYNAFLILSNGTEAKVGTLGSKYEFFHEWKRLSEQEQGSVALETMLRGICKKENFLDLLENFILFDHSGGHTAKILARNHQYLGVNEAIKAYEARKLNNGKLGVFWHTQGSGKSYSMVFLAQKIRRKFSGSPTIVILTDRDELNTQISDTFENCGILGKAKASQFIASSGDDLIDKLKGNPSFIFTLIQKFNKTDVEPIYPDHDIVIMSDEAHRSQYGIFADNMVRLLPTASRIGFTGTPLLSSDNITERTFGGYISVYDFKRAVEDGATVPLYYENRGEKILDVKDNPEITDRILDAIEQADLDVDQQDKLEAEFAKEIHLLTATPRLESIARDFVGHYSDLWTSGKAMFVCLNKVTCVRMYDLAQKYWAAEIEALKTSIKHATQQETQELERKLQWMQETEMAVVISQEQNEIQTFQKWGLDIKTHREKMEKRELDKEFKDPANPLRVVFVCAMWLTGFDVPSLATMYVFKPMKGYNLMQAIARVNRVCRGKEGGLVVDYIGIAKALKKAMHDYTGRDKKNYGDPNIKTTAYQQFVAALKRCRECMNDYDYSAFSDCSNLQRANLIRGGVNVLLDKDNLVSSKPTTQTDENGNIIFVDAAPAEAKKVFMEESKRLSQAASLCRSLLTPAERFEEAYFEAVRTLLLRLSGNNKITRKIIDERITQLLKVAIKAEGIVEILNTKGSEFSLFDENFLKEIAEMKEKNFALELLKRLLEEHIKKYAKKRMVEAEKFSEMLDARLAEYLRGLISNEEVIKELLKMAQELKANAEQASELGLTEEEQAFYDALTKPQAVRDFYENSQLVAMAKELTEALRSSKTIDWRQKESARAKMRSMVKRLLKKYKYPPEEQEAALETVIRQCELYADSDEEI